MQRLRELVEGVTSRGKFLLSSGRESTLYIDGKSVTLSAEGAYLTAAAILERLGDTGFVAIGGPPLGADPIVGAVAALSHAQGHPVSAFLVRTTAKAHGCMKLVEGPGLQGGERVVVVDDVITTGGAVLTAIECLRSEEAARGWSRPLDIVAVTCLVDRGEGGREAIEALGLRYEPLISIDELRV